MSSLKRTAQPTPAVLKIRSRTLRPAGLSSDEIAKGRPINVNAFGLDERAYFAPELLDWPDTCSRWGRMVEHDGQPDMTIIFDRAIKMGADKYSAPGAEENLVVSGASAATLCIGDTLVINADLRSADDIRARIDAGRNPLTLQISAPAPECGGGGGWYARVLVPGELLDGDEFIFSERPHPEWSVQRVATLMAAGSSAPIDQIRELANMSELASTGWRKTFAERVASYDAACSRRKVWGAAAGAGLAAAMAYLSI